jgi:hypothetical protein
MCSVLLRPSIIDHDPSVAATRSYPKRVSFFLVWSVNVVECIRIGIVRARYLVIQASFPAIFLHTLIICGRPISQARSDQGPQRSFDYANPLFDRSELLGGSLLIRLTSQTIQAASYSLQTICPHKLSRLLCLAVRLRPSLYSWQ